MLKEPTQTVHEISKLNLEGNIIPRSWYKHLTKTTERYGTKPYLLAITILSDTVYWYRYKTVENADTGEFIRYERKFSSDILQRSYQQLSEFFGCSKKEARSAIEYLIEKKLSKSEYIENLIKKDKNI